MSKTKVFAGLNKEFVEGLVLTFNGEEHEIVHGIRHPQFRARIIVQTNDLEQFEEKIVGDLLSSSPPKTVSLAKDENRKVSLRNAEKTFFSEEVKMEGNQCTIQYKVFLDRPNPYSGISDIILVPTDIYTIYICLIPSKELKQHQGIQKHIGGYDHLGFFLADLDKMKEIVQAEYGAKELDLIKIFTESDLVDKLFEQGAMVILWGINPYIYQIYSCENVKDIEPFLGVGYGKEGTYKIPAATKNLSIVPGFKLRQWPSLLSEEWPQIELFGEGEKVVLKPYYLKDENIKLIVSFALYRENEPFEESNPLINIDLLN